MITEKDLPIVLLLTADLGFALGAAPLNKKPGSWVHKVDDNWTVACNAHRDAVDVEPAGCMLVTLEPFQMAFWWNGWLAGLVDASGGVIAAHPDGASEKTLVAALAAAIEREKKG